MEIEKSLDKATLSTPKPTKMVSKEVEGTSLPNKYTSKPKEKPLKEKVDDPISKKVSSQPTSPRQDITSSIIIPEPMIGENEPIDIAATNLKKIPLSVIVNFVNSDDHSIGYKLPIHNQSEGYSHIAVDKETKNVFLACPEESKISKFKFINPPRLLREFQISSSIIDLHFIPSKKMIVYQEAETRTLYILNQDFKLVKAKESSCKKKIGNKKYKFLIF